MRVFLDTCILIYGVENLENAGKLVRKAVQDADDETEFCATELVRFEVMVGAARGQNPLLQNEYSDLLSHFTFLPMGRSDFDLAINLRANRNFKPLDALHAATAINHNCTEIWTNDRRFEAVETLGLIKVRILP